jgi:hypothetical protein
MKVKIVLVALLAIVGMVSCDSEDEPTEEKVLSISYRHFGGMMGYSEELTITEKTIHYYYELAVKDETKEINDATPNGLWSNLLNKCDLETFAKIKSGNSNRPVDGLDQVFTIKTKEKEFSIVNGYGNEYEQLYDFFESIMKQIQQYQSND